MLTDQQIEKRNVSFIFFLAGWLKLKVLKKETAL